MKPMSKLSASTFWAAELHKSGTQGLRTDGLPTFAHVPTTGLVTFGARPLLHLSTCFPKGRLLDHGFV